MILATYGFLPPRVASHFDAAGQPNGWMTRAGTVEFSVGLGILLPAFFFGMMALITRLPSNLMHVPNRDDWLSPGGQAQKSTILLRCGIWFAGMSVLFATGLHLLIVEANSLGEGRLSSGGMSLVSAGYLIGMMICSGTLVLRFLRKPE